MLKKITLTFLVLLILGIKASFSYNDLWVQDPQGWNIRGQGTIENATISVRPVGLYMEYGLYLTFSAKGLGFSNADIVEIRFAFDLPEDAIVHDSWLWVDDEIIRGEIMDKWTASSIYEDIVSRRKDPSILFKRSRTQYELLIYPMAGNKSRRVKISYLAPAQWNSKNVLASLPTNVLATSKHPVSTFHLLTWLDDEWENPKIAEFPNIEFQGRYDTTHGNFLRADIPVDAIQSSLHFSVNSPLKNGVYIKNYENNDEGIYQLAFLPSQALDLTAVNKKIAILINYEDANSSITANEIISILKSQLLTQFAPTDSFNLILSNLSIKRASENWMPIDSTVIENAFKNLGQNPLAGYSNLPSLLANGIEFVKTHGNDASLLLLSNSDHLGDTKFDNQLVDDLMSIMDPVLPIHIVDFQTQNFSIYRIGGHYYYGDEYFYINLSRATSANYFNSQSGIPLSELLDRAINSSSGFINFFDLHTKLENGFCFGRYNMNPGSQSTYYNRPILQVGKYEGTFPFVIEASGVYNSKSFTQQITVEENKTFPPDTLSEEIWVGKYIQSLESQMQTNDIVAEIVDNSINHRVLSIYSAFLCLEPSRGGKVCYECFDEVLAGVEQFEKDTETDSLLQAYPNPFNAQTIIKFSTSNSINPKDLTFKIYNIMGQVVRSFEPNGSSDKSSYQFIWDGKDENGITISSGNYFFIASTPHNRYSLKLLLLQ
jgi:hypothetical protein